MEQTVLASCSRPVLLLASGVPRATETSQGQAGAALQSAAVYECIGATRRFAYLRMQASQWPVRSQPRPLAQDQGSQPQLAGAPGAPGAAHSDGPRPAQLLPGASSLSCSPRSARQQKQRRCPALTAAGSGLSSAYIQRPPAYGSAACPWLLLKAGWCRQPRPARRPAGCARSGGSARAACSGARQRTGGPRGRSAQARLGAGAASGRSAPARRLGSGRRSCGGYGLELWRASGAVQPEQRPRAAAAGEQTSLPGFGCGVCG